MAVKRRGDRGKSVRRQSGRREDDIQRINIEGERGKEQEITVRNEAVPPKKASTVWSWYEEFAAEWSETFITKKRKRNPER